MKSLKKYIWPIILFGFAFIILFFFIIQNLLYGYESNDLIAFIYIAIFAGSGIFIFIKQKNQDKKEEIILKNGFNTYGIIVSAYRHRSDLTYSILIYNGASVKLYSLDNIYRFEQNTYKIGNFVKVVCYNNDIIILKEVNSSDIPEETKNKLNISYNHLISN